ncbi:alkaline phosphatase [Marinimicrobium alkaliphilum]|uniref:alkaline phosphatase n=1 Tax=Marinimicrobium alkaliphilum TaxID=2202654 RepID=UPI000DBA528E|nr:alkaline phosphatase [Marinimicrobium alkaliphilum]
MRRLRLTLAALALVAGPSFAEAPNIIVMIGDGMGPAHLTAYRHYQHQGPAYEAPPTILDRLVVGMSSTQPHDDTVVTDSGASATALATGHKTCNQAIAVDCDGEPLRTLFHAAKARGMLTGVVATSQVYHATPASFFAHHRSRHAYGAIADHLMDNTMSDALPVDVIFGGGKRNMVREDRNLVEALQAEGYTYADNLVALEALSRAPALALLADSGLPHALDNPEARVLARMTERALALVDGHEQGFVMMIEGSQIDWCSHANDIACTLAEMHDFAEAARVAKAFIRNNPNTLLVITGDHETGGLSVGANNEYQWLPDVIRNVKHSAGVLSRLLRESETWEQTWLDNTGLTLEDEEKAALYRARAAGQDPLADAIKDLINRRSHTGWTSGGHTAVDVPILAYGAHRERFAGFVDNAEIGRRLIELLEN